MEGRLTNCTKPVVAPARDELLLVLIGALISTLSSQVSLSTPIDYSMHAFQRPYPSLVSLSSDRSLLRPNP